LKKGEDVMIGFRSAKSLVLGGLAASAVLMVAAAPAAAYTGTPLANGMGFVGKGEVQTPWGWNNSTLQKYAAGVTFSMESSAVYAQDCEKSFTREEWVNIGEPYAVYNAKGALIRYDQDQERVTVNYTNEKTFAKSVTINAALNGDPRQTKGQNQFTGFNLKGFGDTSGDTVPTDLCTPGMGEGEENNGWKPALDENGYDVTVQKVDGSEVGALFAHHVATGKTTQLQDTTPVVVTAS
jgi:hypothetical protein